MQGATSNELDSLMLQLMMADSEESSLESGTPTSDGEYVNLDSDSAQEDTEEEHIGSESQAELLVDILWNPQVIFSALNGDGDANEESVNYKRARNMSKWLRMLAVRRSKNVHSFLKAFAHVLKFVLCLRKNKRVENSDSKNNPFVVPLKDAMQIYTSYSNLPDNLLFDKIFDFLLRNPEGYSEVNLADLELIARLLSGKYICPLLAFDASSPKRRQ
ncbi:unnamed protein product [Notodromas monacha]|uniref:Uncharacterized protein n=1 Tax=Notodromas monacha TaxID=399045 RepID=A0A7R9BQZ6_9CRUS|nr:unnamed protein product [Notodromas monacha]CAG0919186.1 unnamed protein product [Notodromas monacha]